MNKLEEKIKEFELILIQEANSDDTYILVRHQLTVLLEVYREHFNLKDKE